MIRAVYDESMGKDDSYKGIKMATFKFIGQTLCMERVWTIKLWGIISFYCKYHHHPYSHHIIL